MFPAPVRAACAQVGLVPTSVRALRTLGRATAAWRSGGATQEAASGAAKVAIPAILTHLPDPGLAVRLQDGRSRRSAVPYTTWTKRRQRAGQPRDMGGSFPRSQSCDIPRMAVFCRKSTTLYSNLKKNARPAVFLNRTHQLYNALGSQGQPKTFDFWI